MHNVEKDSPVSLSRRITAFTGDVRRQVDTTPWRYVEWVGDPENTDKPLDFHSIPGLLSGTDRDVDRFPGNGGRG